MACDTLGGTMSVLWSQGVMKTNYLILSMKGFAAGAPGAS
jgi:hypothetical protein